MIRMVWQRIIHRKMAVLTLLFALIALFVLIPLGLHQSEEATSKVDDAIKEHGRGTYDILVRPPSSRSDIEQAKGVVANNYIGDGSGGISIDEWEDMKADPDIAVAAPVASLGYFRGNQTSVELPVMDDPTRLTYQFYTSNGQDKYATSKESTYIYFKKIRDGLIQYLGEPSSDFTMGSAHMNTLMPPTHYLLTAVDVASEEQLTGMDLSALHKQPELGSFKDILEQYGNPPLVKVLQRDDLNIPVHMKLKAETIDADLNDYLDRLDLNKHDWIEIAGTDNPKYSSEEYDSVLNELKEKKAEETKSTWINLSPFQHPFNGTALQLNKAFEPSVSQQSAGDIDTTVYYTSSKIDYDNLDGTPKVNIVEDGNPPAYKQVENKGISMKQTFDVPFMVKQMGTFTPSSIPESKLAASPLGIYGGMKAETEDGETLKPTTKPGSFIAQPASGLTTLESAEIIKGDDPIDAVRIKVAGITAYNEAARKKIETISTDLLKKGYEVDVVAGSSFQEMTLDVEGIGNVKETWTTLGVAQELSQTWNNVMLLTIGLFTAFGLLWLVVRLALEKNTLTTENTILYTLGWRKSKITLRNTMEQYSLITIAFLFSLLILYIIEASTTMYTISAGLWAIAILTATLLLNKRQTTQTRSRQYRFFAAIRYHKRLIFPAMLILLLSTVLISVQLATLGSSYQKASATSLGEYANDLTVWLQLSVMVSTFVLAVISTTESINILLGERKREFEMFHVIGWRRSRIVRHLLKETSVWTGLALGSGVILSGLLLVVLQVSFAWTLIGVGVSVGLSVIAILTIVLTRPLGGTRE